MDSLAPPLPQETHRASRVSQEGERRSIPPSPTAATAHVTCTLCRPLIDVTVCHSRHTPHRLFQQAGSAGCTGAGSTLLSACTIHMEHTPSAHLLPSSHHAPVTHCLGRHTAHGLTAQCAQHVPVTPAGQTDRPGEN